MYIKMFGCLFATGQDRIDLTLMCQRMLELQNQYNALTEKFKSMEEDLEEDLEDIASTVDCMESASSGIQGSAQNPQSSVNMENAQQKVLRVHPGYPEGYNCSIENPPTIKGNTTTTIQDFKSTTPPVEKDILSESTIDHLSSGSGDEVAQAEYEALTRLHEDLGNLMGPWLDNVNQSSN